MSQRKTRPHVLETKYNILIFSFGFGLVVHVFIRTGDGETGSLAQDGSVSVVCETLVEALV